jgi:hypothetical protein
MHIEFLQVEKNLILYICQDKVMTDVPIAQIIMTDNIEINFSPMWQSKQEHIKAGKTAPRGGGEHQAPNLLFWSS